MSMDPDGTNRIIHQQIKEWHTIVDQERDAKGVARDAPGFLSRSLAVVRLVVGHSMRLVAAVPAHLPHLPVSEPSADAARKPADEAS